MNEKIDINYIAKKANVSRSTVSRVLTKKTNVKESTREKVEQVMAELNYHQTLWPEDLLLENRISSRL